MNILSVSLLLLQVQLGSASGVVMRPGGTEPLAGATVTLNPVVATQTSPARSTVTEEAGRFTISDIEPGEYRLQVQSARFGNASYGERKPAGPGTVLRIAAGQRLTDLKITMTPTGAIAGRITGRSGEPIAYAPVQAQRYLYQDGKRTLSVAQTATTDDRGQYRLFWLHSGKYVVVAGPRASPANTGPAAPIRPGDTYRQNEFALFASGLGFSSDALLGGSNLTKRILADGTILEESWMPTYYPAVVDRTQATEIEVTAGSTVTGIDIALGPSPVQRVRGRVSGVTRQATVTLATGNQGMIGRSLSDGSFEFAGVLPGVYSLAAQDPSGLVSTPVAVLVGDRDVENVSIALSPPIAISVRLTVDGATPGPLDPLTGIIGRLVPDLDTLRGGAPTNARSAEIQLGAGNVMPFPNVAAGDYRFAIGQSALRENLKPLYIKSARLGREDALNTFHVSADSANVLEVVLTTETGSVEGVAINRAGDPAANATVVLVPTNARKRMALYQALVTGSDGRFRFQEIPPGDYKVFAWDDVETGAWANAEFLRPYESRGRAVRVSENSKEEVSLKVIYTP